MDRNESKILLSKQNDKLTEIKVNGKGFEYIMIKTVLHSTPQWINLDEDIKFTIDDIGQNWNCYL